MASKSVREAVARELWKIGRIVKVPYSKIPTTTEKWLMRGADRIIRIVKKGERLPEYIVVNGHARRTRGVKLYPIKDSKGRFKDIGVKGGKK